MLNVDGMKAFRKAQERVYIAELVQKLKQIPAPAWQSTPTGTANAKPKPIHDLPPDTLLVDRSSLYPLAATLPEGAADEEDEQELRKCLDEKVKESIAVTKDMEEYLSAKFEQEDKPSAPIQNKKKRKQRQRQKEAKQRAKEEAERELQKTNVGTTNIGEEGVEEGTLFRLFAADACIRVLYPVDDPDKEGEGGLVLRSGKEASKERRIYLRGLKKRKRAFDGESELSVSDSEDETFLKQAHQKFQSATTSHAQILAESKVPWERNVLSHKITRLSQNQVQIKSSTVKSQFKQYFNSRQYENGGGNLQGKWGSFISKSLAGRPGFVRGIIQTQSGTNFKDGTYSRGGERLGQEKARGRRREGDSLQRGGRGRPSQARGRGRGRGRGR